MKEAMTGWVKSMARPRMERRIPAVFFCIFMMGVCVAVLDRISLGTDPCSSFNLGMSNLIGWSFGTWQMVFNIFLLIIVLRFDTSRIGLGTVLNGFGVGYVADFTMYILDFFPMISDTMPLYWRWAILLCVGVVFLIVVSIYMVVDMGVAPYDAMPQIISKKLKVSFRWVRIGWDVVMMTAGFLLGSTIGPMTFLVAFGLGPMVGAVAKRIEPFFN